jgi:hypothetical protein
MKICLLNDSHFGVRNDHRIFQESQTRFFRDQFFPYIDKHGIRTLIHLGDLVDRRKYINYQSGQVLRKELIDPLYQRAMDCHWLIGNHDTTFKATNELNAQRELYSHSKLFHKNYIYENPAEVEIGGCKMLFLPWICDANEAQSIHMIEHSTASTVMGHLQLIGFEHQKGGHMETEGLQPSMFARFDRVITGHFHTRMTRGNISYLGCQYEMTWADCDDPKGFHVFDTETKKLDFIYNPDCMFFKDYYDETKVDLQALDFSRLKGRFVRVIVLNKTDQYKFDKYQAFLEAKEPFDLKVIDHDVGIQIDDETLIEAEDTLTILQKTVEQTPTECNKPMLVAYLTTLHNKAVSME